MSESIKWVPQQELAKQFNMNPRTLAGRLERAGFEGCYDVHGNLCFIFNERARTILSRPVVPHTRKKRRIADMMQDTPKTVQDTVQSAYKGSPTAQANMARCEMMLKQQREEEEKRKADMAKAAEREAHEREIKLEMQKNRIELAKHIFGGE